MQLDIVFGKTIKLATREVVRRIELSNDLSLNNFIVVPDRFSMQMEKLIFEELKICSTFNIEVISVSRLANLILRLSGNSFSMLNNVEGMLLIYKILIENKENLASFKDANLSIELANEIYLTVSQLKSCEISVEEFAGRAGLSNSQKLLDIARVYEIYESIEKEKIDASDLLRLFQEQIESSEMVKNSNFYFAEFDSFTAQVETILKLLVKSAKKVVVGAPYSDEKNSYIYEKDILQKLFKIAKELAIEPNMIEAKNSLNDFQNHILRNLFATKQSVKPIKDEVAILKSLTPLDEVKEVANIIKFEIAKHGSKYKDFNIILSGLEGYSKYIREIFAYEGISFYVDQNESLGSLLPVRFVFDLLRYLQQKNAENFLQLVGGEFSSLGEKEVYLIHNSIFEFGKKIDYFISDNFAEENNIFNFLEKIEKIEGKFKKINNFNNFIEILKEIYNVFEFDKVVEQFICKFKTCGDLQNEKLYIQFASKFEKALKQLDDLQIEANFKIEDMIFVAKEIFKNISISNLPLSVDAVFVGESGSSFFEERKISVFLGCVAGQLPVVQKDAGIILDGEIEKYELKIEPTMQMINRRNKFKLFNDALLASDKVYLSQSGKVNESCEFVKNFSKMFSADEKSLPLSDDFYIDATSDRKLILNDLVFNSVMNLNKAEIRNYLRGKECQKELTLQKIENAEAVLYPKRATSISKIQKFYSCPFAHFAEYGLGLRELACAEIDHLDIGVFFHAFAEKFLALCKGENYKISDGAFISFVNLAYDFAKSSNERLAMLSGLDELKGYFKYLRMQAQDFARELLNQIEVSEFKPEEFEKYFTIQLGETGFKINGVIDRIDRAGDLARVIDYKTGEVKISLTELYAGKQLQLPIYLLALKDRIVGAFYVPVFESSGNKDKRLGGYFEKDTQVIKKFDKTLSPSKLKSDVINLSLTKSSTESEFKVYQRTGVLQPGNLEKIANYAKKVVEDGVKESLTGKIDALPTFENFCESCPYYSLCGYSFNFGEKREKIEAVKEQTIISLLEN